MNTEYKNALLKQFEKWLNAQSYSGNTKTPYLRITKKFLDYIDGFAIDYIKDVNKELVLKFISSRGDAKYAKAYIRLRESAIDLFFAWAKNNRHCPYNPITDFRKSKLNLKPFPKKPTTLDVKTITILTDDEQKQLLDALAEEACTTNDKFLSLRNINIITMILNTAIYAEELIKLAVNDFGNGCISVRSRQNKKRCIPLVILPRFNGHHLFKNQQAYSSSAGTL